jgi:hypothetical protein
VSFEDVSVLVMDQFFGCQHGLPGIDSGRKAALENGGFVPGNGVHGKVTDSRTLCRKREKGNCCNTAKACGNISGPEKSGNQRLR